MVTSHHPRCKRSRSLDLSSESPAVLWSLGCLMPSLRVLGALLGGTSQNTEQQEKKSKTHTHTNKPLQYGSGNTNACSPYCDCAGVCCDADCGCACAPFLTETDISKLRPFSECRHGSYCVLCQDPRLQNPEPANHAYLNGTASAQSQ